MSNKPPTQAGVYKINCSICNIPYIGQTGKEISTRTKQHQYIIRTANNTSALFCHVRDLNHPIDWNSAEVIYRSSSVTERLLVEGCLIASFENMNLAVGLFKIDELLKYLIFKDPKVKRASRYF